MPDAPLTEDDARIIHELVAHYEANNGLIQRYLVSLDTFIRGSEALSPLIHSVKSRMKDPLHLRDKLERKLKKLREQGKPFHITKDNLFIEITDLAGYRVLHLHTTQMDGIDKALRQVIAEAQCTLIEGPRASVWDQESENYFKRIGITTEYNPRMYSSVHYVVQPNSKAKVTIEIQVRTLSEEVWGEVDHKFNYPHPIDSIACGEQIKVLARVASGCTRLVDSIFASYADWEAKKGPSNS